MIKTLRQSLERLLSRGTLRSLREVSSPQGREIFLEGQKVLNFSSNDYLGLASDVRVVEAAVEVLRRRGFGAGASRLISGSMDEHLLLEREIAAFKGTEAALLFPSGYMANGGIIPALCGREDVVISDRLNHASLTDGILLSRAEHLRYAHANVGALEGVLQRTGSFRRRLIVTDTVFSMDGDIAPLSDIVELAKRYRAWVMVDEAHAFGILGPSGGGLVDLLGLNDSVEVQMGTLSKAAGGSGAYCAGKRELIDHLINAARSFIYTTSMPPAIAGGLREALRIIQAEPERREILARHAGRLRQGLRDMGFNTMASVTPIIPVMIGGTPETVAFSARLLSEGIFAQAIRPPTVPEGTARLRLTVTAAHRDEDIEQCLTAFRKVRPCP
ncbi:MAG: 8-amino-7-oxononanoate synthase [Elusimicrobia bacterium]|nr:8-amino-7-oxononanoate synthase [Elusimicrobiota bacterium]